MSDSKESNASSYLYEISGKHNSKKKIFLNLNNQDNICDFFCSVVKEKDPNWVIREFENLFFHLATPENPQILQALCQIIEFKQEDIFRNTFIRVSYILINNWNSKRQQQYIQRLGRVFANISDKTKAISPNQKRLKNWLINFTCTQEYQELDFFISRSKSKAKSKEYRAGKLCLTSRYASYLLANQSQNNHKPEEQREAAQLLYQQLKEQFKFDLAMYTARSQSAFAEESKQQNPTILGDQVLHLIKKILVKQRAFSYSNLANIFLKQTEGITYSHFKKSLVKYLINSFSKNELTIVLHQNTSNYLKSLYTDYDKQIWNSHLLLRTSNRLLELLTTEKRGKPSVLMTLFTKQGKSLTLAILILKIILICPQSRGHLESCIAYLIQYFEEKRHSDYQWLILFLETLEVTFAICLENVNYNVLPTDAKTIKLTDNFEYHKYLLFSQVQEDVTPVD